MGTPNPICKHGSKGSIQRLGGSAIERLGAIVTTLNVGQAPTQCYHHDQNNDDRTKISGISTSSRRVLHVDFGHLFPSLKVICFARRSSRPTERKRPGNRGASKFSRSEPQAATFVGSTTRSLLELAIGIARGFIASGISRTRSTLRSPFSRLAHLTWTWSASWKIRSKVRSAMP